MGLFWVCVCVPVSQAVAADDVVAKVQLTAKPVSCVALHKGQRCFQKIQFFWESNEGLEYCLYSDTHKRKLFCAKGNEAAFVHSYASDSSELFSLRLGESGLTVSTIRVSTSWVYRTGKRSSSGWRLF
jgi:hypothetical protein